MDEELERKLQGLTPAQRALFLKLQQQQRSPAPAAASIPLRETAQPEHYALSFAQQRFWLLEQLHPGEPAHHLSGVLLLNGALDRDALQLAVDRVVARRATLRQSFRDIDGEPRATDNAEARCLISFEDLSALSERDQTGARDRLLTMCTSTPFDLRTPPLLRAQLVRLHAEHWQLFWCVHHIAADGLSMLQLVADLQQQYDTLATNPHAEPQPDTSLGYHDFAQWTFDRERAGEFHRGRAFFEARLADLPTTRLLPDHQRHTPNAHGGRVQLGVQSEVSAALLHLARANDCTPFVTLLTGFLAALHRWTGDDDLVLGTPFANRNHPRLQDAFGLFVNSVVLRCRIEPNTTFRALLLQVRTLVQETFVHADVPFEHLVQHLAPERHLDRNPLFQVMFNFVDFADVDATPAGMHWQYQEAPAGTLFDFTLYVRQRGDSLLLEAEYDQSLFALTTMQSRLHELHTLLQGAVLDADLTIQALPLLLPATQDMLRRWETGAPLPPGASDALGLVRDAAQHSDHVRLADGEACIDGERLLQLVTQLGSALRHEGVRPGDRVAFFLPRSRWLPVTALAIWHAGATAVPLDPAQPPARREAILNAAAPKFVVTSQTGPSPEQTAARDLAIEDLQRPCPTHPAVDVAGNTPAYLLFTSGSTGAPKGVVVPHASLAAFLRAMRQTLPLQAYDSLLAITSPSFDIAWLEWLLPLCAGGAVHIASEDAARDGTALARELASTRATFLQATPSTYRLLLAVGFRGNEQLQLLCGGEALPDALAQQLRACCSRLWNLYGPTETTIWSTVHEVGSGPVRIGHPIPGSNVFVIAPDGQRVPPGCPGELLISGAGLALGYDADANATAERFVTDPEGIPAYRTGDLVRFDTSGELQFLGRVDDQIKVRGHRIEPAAVEAWLSMHADVLECAVQVVTENDSKQLVAHVVSNRIDATDTDAWHGVWQQTYQHGSAADADFDHRGWLDSRTGEPLSSDVMRRFVRSTALRIEALGCQRVLEVGCGTGMLVAALADKCERWHATDATAAAVAAVESLAQRRGLANVTTQQLRADELAQLPTNAFDCVVINSVAQYFPSLNYLLDVLAEARRVLRPGGVVFVGDVRLLPLQAAAATWVELAAAPPETTPATVAANCERRIANDPELLLAPELFSELVSSAAFADHWIALRAGDDDTEMDRFRADAVLTTDTQFNTQTSLPDAPDNARVAASWHAAELLRSGASGNLDTVRKRAEELAKDAPRPEPPAIPSARTHCVAATAGLPDAASLRSFANTPRPDRHALANELRRHLRTHLPANVVPQQVVWHEQLPRLASGKVDRRSLQATLVKQSSTSLVAPTTDTEQKLAALFAEVLAQPAIGREHDFFASGGHSLGAARLAARIRESFSVDLALRQIFATPLLHELAACIDASQTGSARQLQPRPADAPLLPGPTMQRLWFLQRLTPGSRAYLMLGVVEAPQELELPTLQRALADVVKRHEVLRLRIDEVRGQAVLRETTEAVPFTQLPDERTLHATLAATTGDTMLPLQVFCCERSTGGWCLAFVLHHAFLDGWSLAVLRRDLATAYQAHLRQQPTHWPALPLQYLDFAHWQTAQSHEPARTFWQQELHELPPPLDLPTRRLRPAKLKECGERLPAPIDALLFDQASAFAQEHGATTFLVFLATYQLWLRRLSNQHDVIVGTTLANREHTSLENAMGSFLQTMPVRGLVRDSMNFDELLEATKQTFLRCTEHLDLPFHQLVEAVDAPRLLNRTPLFQTTLDWLNHPEHAAEGSDLAWRDCDYDPHTSKFELSVIVTKAAPFTAFIEFRSDLFDAATVASWWRSFTCLLEQAIRSPHRPLQELAWLDQSQQQFLLAQGEGVTRDWPHANVVAAWQEQVARTPAAIAIASPEQTSSYASAHERVLQIAATLQQRGVTPGQRIAICLPRSSEQLLAMLAVLHLGCAYVPIGVAQPPLRAASMFARAGVTLAICSDARQPPFANLPSVRFCATTASDPAIAEFPEITPATIAYVLFTSGSTGEPKGVAVSHRALANYAFWANEHYAQPRSAPLHTPLGFDLSLTSLWPVWLAGGAVHTTHEPDSEASGIEALLQASEHAPFAITKLTPSHLDAWHASGATRMLAHGLVLGGEALHLGQLRASLDQHVRIWNEYGPTEATVGCAVREITTADGEHGPAAIGRPIANTRLYVLDAERRLVPRGVVGELWIAGHCLANGYEGRDDLTEQRFCADPFVPTQRMYRTGDYASWHSHGDDTIELHYHGRKDEQRKLRGHRIELGEVRAYLLRLPAIRDAAATVLRAPSGSEQLVAYVVGDVDHAEARHNLQQHLPPHAIPAHIVAVHSLPIDRHGKLDSKRLPSPWQTAGKPGQDPEQDTASVELLRLASELLRVPDLQPDDDFFRAGGDSILALQLVARAADLGLQLEIRDVFEHATVASLRRVARRVEQNIAAPLQGGLLAMQRWFFAQELVAPSHYDQAVWLRCKQPVTADDLRAALDSIVARHPALRTAFVPHNDCIQQHVLADGVFKFATLDLRAHDTEARERALTTVAATSGFDLTTGLLFAATLLHLDRDTDWLYLRAHHLAVDAVSWVTILSDLQSLLAGAALPPAPPPPLAFAQPPSALAPLLAQDGINDFVPAPLAGVEGAAAEHVVTFSNAELQTMHAAKAGAHRIETIHLLASAAAQAVPNHGMHTRCRVDLERHGRVGASARTVGWFTEVHSAPLDVLDVANSSGLRRIKECMGAADRDPDHQQPAAPILLNYLGAIFAANSEGDLLEVLDRDAGTLRAPTNQRSHAFEVRAHERDGELQATCIAPDAQQAEHLAHRFADALRALVDATTTATAETSPADFPLATLPEQQTIALLASRNDIEQLYPLTATQQGMLFASLEHQDAPIYREQLAAVIEGPLQVEQLEIAFQSVCARHELLRGEVHWRGLHEPHWLIPRHTQVPFARTQLPCRDDETEFDAVKRRLAELRRARFAFGSEPLLRIEVAALADERHALLVTYHHVILDGWSMPLLLAEAVHHYRAHCGETMPQLPSAQPFADHVAFLQRQDLQEHQNFWRERLGTFCEPLHLRGDGAPADTGALQPASPTYGECERWLTPPRTQALREAAEQQRVTISTLLQTAWALVLARWSGQDDVLFGVTVAGRPTELTEVAQRIGLFINTVPLRVHVNTHTTANELLSQVQRDVVQILAHQHTPLPVSQAQTGVPAGTDPFETLLVFENYPLEEAMRELPNGLRVTTTTAFERTSYALTLVAIPGEQLCLRLLHQDDRFSTAFAERLLQCVDTVLQQLAATPHSPTSNINWLTAEDRARAASLAIGPQADYEPHVLQRVLATAHAQPDAIAIASTHNGVEQHVTYRQLLQQSERVAQRLVQQGVGEDSLVAFRGERSTNAIATLLGIWRSGAAYLPIDPQWPAQQVADILATSAPQVFVDTSAEPLATDDVGEVALPEVNELRALAYAIATSGTTGQPKIVRVAHGSLANYIGAAVRQFALTPHDRVLQFASFAFDTAAEEIWPTLSVGATLVLRRAEQASSSAAFLRTSREQRVTVWDLPTAFFHSLFAATAPLKASEIAPDLRLCIVGGQAVEAPAANTFLKSAPNARLWNTYGPSEATIVATWCELRAPLTGRPPIGTPVPGTEAWVLDRNQHPVPPGLPGELCLVGAGLARDYLDAAATHERFVVLPDGRRAFRTGDLARHRPDGLLEFLGRIDRQLKIAGVRIEPDAIEATLQQHPSISEACVRTIGAGEALRLVAFVVAQDAGVDEALIRTFLRAHLPSASVPTQIVITADLPRLVSGKVDLHALQVPAPMTSATQAASNANEQAVLDIFSTLFGHRAVGVEDDFFDIGGSSLVAVRLLDALHEHFRVELSIQALFADPTPRGIARVLRSPEAAAASIPVERMRADARLSEDFVVANKPVPASQVRASHVLLTGATGFFGRHVLKQLLRSGTERIYCLVRARDLDTARARLAQQLATINIELDSRVTVVCGDVALADLGLSPEQLQELGETAHSVVHVAAQVDFLRPYAQLRDANVEGTRNLLTFCAQHALPLHHVSSIGVFADPRTSELATIAEHHDLDQCDQPVGGYAQSKWVSEQLVRAASQRGLLATIHRPGRLVADSETGIGNDDDFVTALLVLCRDIGMVVAMPPLLKQCFDVTPVDYAARLLVASISCEAATGETMHLVHADPPPLGNLLKQLRASGWQLQPCDWAEFQAAATHLLAANPHHPAAAMLPFLQASPTTMRGLAEPHFASQHTRSLLGANAPACPAIDDALLQRWLERLPK